MMYPEPSCKSDKYKRENEHAVVPMGVEVGGDGIRISRELSDLDRFVLDVVHLIEKHANYVIVSGYVTYSSAARGGRRMWTL